MEGITTILLDIEGTVCSIAFVKDTLVPYATAALPHVLATQWDHPAFSPYRHAFPLEHRRSPRALQAHVQELTQRDVKVAYLKNLQGYLWETGYKTGAYRTELFPDVLPQLRQWKQEGYTLAVYSSGSIFAQKLLFAHVKVAPETAASSAPTDTNGASHDSPPAGTDDLTALFEPNWFDTATAGLKTESASYRTIADALKRKPEEVLFLSDNVKEVDAAIEAGMKSIVVDRPGNATLAEADKQRLPVVTSLAAAAISPPAASGEQ